MVWLNSEVLVYKLPQIQSRHDLDTVSIYALGMFMNGYQDENTARDRFVLADISVCYSLGLCASSQFG